MRRNLGLAALAVLVAGGCGRFGQVNQGRVVEYDARAGVMTVVSDSHTLPPAVVKIPADPGEMGPAPEPGRLLRIEPQQRRLLAYEPAGPSLRTIFYTPVSEAHEVRETDPRVAGKSFPLLDPATRAVTTYDPAARLLVRFTVAAADFALPPETWKAGDEVRYYFRQPGQALRLMNVTRTDLGK